MIVLEPLSWWYWKIENVWVTHHGPKCERRWFGTPTNSIICNLLGIEHLPTLAVVLEEEFLDVPHVREIDEGVPHVAFILIMNGHWYREINWKVEEIVLIEVVDIHILQDQRLGVLVRDVTDHQRCTAVEFHLQLIVKSVPDQGRFGNESSQLEERIGAFSLAATGMAYTVCRSVPGTRIRCWNYYSGWSWAALLT